MKNLEIKQHGPVTLRSGVIAEATGRARTQGRPIFLIVIATRPCYTKLASLIFACEELKLPYVAIESGQHYESRLVGAKNELGFEQHIGAWLDLGRERGFRGAQFFSAVSALNDMFHELAPLVPVIPVVSGDTFTAGVFPQIWYFLRCMRCVHVEAGLRSEGPVVPCPWEDVVDIREQRSWEWVRVPDEPFPEGVNSRLASVVSGIQLAPVHRNAQNLLREGFSESVIRIVGSLSSDAVNLAQNSSLTTSVFDIYPELSEGTWLRVDLHRRENMTKAKLSAVLGGLGKLCQDGHRVVLVRSNALDAALLHFDLGRTLSSALSHGLRVHESWGSYGHVVEFLKSEQCRAVYTDSGGLQEEAHLCGTQCFTCRYSTDRPETVLDAGSNLLIPPVSEKFVHSALSSRLASTWIAPVSPPLYGSAVGKNIAGILLDTKLPHACEGMVPRY